MRPFGILVSLACTLSLCSCDEGVDPWGGPSNEALLDGFEVKVPPAPADAATADVPAETAADLSSDVVPAEVVLPFAADFAMQDLNPASVTAGRTVSLSDLRGDVVVLYFGLATCPLCHQQAVYLDAVQQDFVAMGYSRVHILVVNWQDTEAAIPDFAAGISLPVLQDTAQKYVWAVYQAGKDTTLVIDGLGRVRNRWPYVAFSSQSQYLVDAIVAALD